VIDEAGQDAAARTKALWDEIRAERDDNGQSMSDTVARREIRKWLSEFSEGPACGGVGGSVVARLTKASPIAGPIP